jgi:uncharacterized coiled-coil protein SlyX
MAQILNLKLRDAHIAHPDGRRREHKAAVRQAYESTIDELVEQLDEKDNTVKRESNKIRQLKRQLRDAGVNEEPHQDNTCLICTDDMDGKVSLRCGHEMCPDCFAQHSRVNNTCPFCRDEFAPKVKIPNKLPDEALNAMADNWSTTTRQTGYFHHQLSTNRERSLESRNIAEDHLEWLVRENSKILMRSIKRWYDNEIN